MRAGADVEGSAEYNFTKPEVEGAPKEDPIGFEGAFSASAGYQVGKSSGKNKLLLQEFPRTKLRMYVCIK